MPSDRQKKANNALGISLIAGALLMETIVADHYNPSPASPWIWGALGIVILASLGYYLRSRRDAG